MVASPEPLTNCNFWACVICASSASARVSGVVGAGVGVGVTDKLTPQAVNPRASGRISRKTAGIFALRRLWEARPVWKPSAFLRAVAPGAGGVARNSAQSTAGNENRASNIAASVYQNEAPNIIVPPRSRERRQAAP